MKVLLVGSGGREHALAWAIAQSDLCDALYCAPGNAGIRSCAEIVDIGAEDVDALTTFAAEKKIDLVVVGPEAPLVAGLADKLRAKGIATFGPSAAAAQLEGSKGFMKDLCRDNNIPTAAYQRFTEVEPAAEFIQSLSVPVVVKADGLAAGKGVIIAQSHDEAIETVEDMLSGEAFGDAGRSVVVEEFLDGEELSYFALSDGKNLLPLTSAQDHKRVGDGDTGPNTGGMGAYSPAHFMTPELEEKIIERIMMPTVRGMADKGCPFTGVIFAGLMVVDNEPYLIEHNVRFGDPECQTIMLRLQGDLLDVLNKAATGKLDEVDIGWYDDVSLCVVMAANGYPGAYEKGSVIKGLDKAAQVEGAQIFHAGTKEHVGEVLSNGGRVLGVCAVGETVKDARDQAYKAVDAIDWPEGFCRRDIAFRALKAE
jgi:phosphoribosylamine--glycine ligase